MSCDCPADDPESPGVALRPPQWDLDVQRTINQLLGRFGSDPQPIWVDACIAGVVRHVWDGGFVTEQSCCGHGEGPPMLVIGRREDPAAVRGRIAEVDDREWLLQQWRLVDCD